MLNSLRLRLLRTKNNVIGKELASARLFRFDKRFAAASSTRSVLSRFSSSHATAAVSPVEESLLTSTTNNSQFVPGRMVIGFKCKVCSHPSVKQMSKHAYEKGVVIIKCDGCKNHHLIADHLGWFDSQKRAGTIEDIMKEKGESVTRLDFNSDQQVKDYEAAASKDAKDDGLLEFVAKRCIA